MYLNTEEDLHVLNLLRLDAQKSMLANKPIDPLTASALRKLSDEISERQRKVAELMEAM